MLAQLPLDELKLGIVLLAPRRRRLELVLDLLHPILEECCASTQLLHVHLTQAGEDVVVPLPGRQILRRCNV